MLTALSGGLYVVIVAVAAAIGTAVKVVYDLVTAEKRLEESQKAVADSAKDTTEGLKKQVKDYENIISIRRRGLEDELSTAETSGKSQEKIFAIKKKIADFDKFNANVIKSGADVNNASLNTVISKYEEARDKVQFFNNEIERSAKIQEKNAKIGTFEFKDRTGQDIDDLKKQKELAQSQLDALSAEKEYQQSILEKAADAQRKVDELSNEEQKFNADERRKITLEYTKFEQDLIKDKNAKILANEESTLKQRLAAIRSNAAAEKATAIAERNNVLRDPSSSQADKSIATRQANVEEIKINRDKKKQIHDITLDYNNKILKADKDLQDAELSQFAKYNEQRYSDQFEDLDKRLQALVEYNKEEKKIILSDYNYQKTLLNQKDSSNEEYLLLEAQKNAKLVELTYNSQKKITDIYKSVGAENLAIQESFYKFIAQDNLNDLANSEDYVAKVIELNNSLLKNKMKNKIGLSSYDRKREDIDNDFKISSLKNTIKHEEDLLAAHDQKDIALQKKLIEDKAALSDAESAKKIKDKKEFEAKGKELAEVGYDTTVSFADAGYEYEKNRIQKLIDLNDAYYSRELENIQRSTLSQEDRAIQTIQIEAKQNAKRLALQKQYVTKKENRRSLIAMLKD